MIKREDFDQVMVPNYAPSHVIPVKGQGSLLWDQTGKEYVDFGGGIAVNSLGHAHPSLQKALADQAQQLWHVSNLYTNEAALKLAKLLTAKTFADRVFFCNSGAEANEAALKLARKYGRDQYNEKKTQIIAFENGFHGRTLFTVSVGGQPKYSKDFAPLPTDITHLPFNNIKTLEDAISDETCAVILEPIQGEGGVNNADPEFLKAARKLCDKHGALLIFDEVQTGVGRTGTLYAYQQSGVTPDILTSAKGLGGGFPIGAMLTTSAIAASLSVGTHGTTYGGNLLACAVASTVIEIVDQPATYANVAARRQQMEQSLQQINEKYKCFTNFTGKGLLLGAQLAESWHGKASEIWKAAVNEGVMILVAGPNVLRFAPALNIPEHIVSKGMESLERAIESV